MLREAIPISLINIRRTEVRPFSDRQSNYSKRLLRKNLAEPNQNVRGVIVAREISEDLLQACSVIPGVELFEHELSLSLKRVDEARP